MGKTSWHQPALTGGLRELLHPSRIRNSADSAFEYVQANGGVDTEASYPYEARTKTCRFNAATVGATCTGYVDIKQGSESDLMAAIASVGPVSVAIDASRSSFQLYRSGVYFEPRCCSRSLDL